MFPYSVWAGLGVGEVCALAWVCLWLLVLACVCGVGGGVSGAWVCGGVGAEVFVCGVSGCEQ
jgi:hypothetical protein